MRDEEKTKSELLEEVHALQKRIDELKLLRPKEGAEEEIKRTKDFLSNIIDSSLDSIIVTDSRGLITRTNTSFLNLLDVEKDDVIGKLTAAFSISDPGRYLSTTGEWKDVDDAFYEDAKSTIEILHETGRISNWETYFIRKDQKIVPVECNVSLIYDDHQELIGSVGVIRDITERRMNEQLTLRAHENEKLGAIAEIAGAAAHELNQPLTSVLTSVAMLRRILDNGETTQRVLDTIEQESDRMATMIRRLTKITNYKTKKYVGNAKIIDLASAAAEAPPKEDD